MTGIPRVRVSGTARERGLQYGEQARARVHRSVEAYREVFAHYAGWDWDTVRREAARFEAPIAAFGHRYLEEMRGIADGAGLGLADVLAINVRTEIMLAATARKAANPDQAAHPQEQSATITSVLMDLTEGQMWLAAGNPCAEPYELLWRAA